MSSVPDRTLESPKAAMLALYAALTVEHERWGLDATTTESLAFLREATSLTCNTLAGDRVTVDVSPAEKADWVADYRSRLSSHERLRIERPALNARMNRVMAGFRFWGFNENYAGFEGQLRVRFCAMVGGAEFESVDDSVWNTEFVQREAAAYLAYTDYYDAELRRCGM